MRFLPPNSSTFRSPAVNLYARLSGDLFGLSICSYDNGIILDTHYTATSGDLISSDISDPKIHPRVPAPLVRDHGRGSLIDRTCTGVVVVIVIVGNESTTRWDGIGGR